MFRPVMVDQPGKTSVFLWNLYVNYIDVVDFSDTSTEFCSFAKNIFSSTKMSEEGLSEREKQERTDPQLLKPIPGPDLSSVLSFWGRVQEINLQKS